MKHRHVAEQLTHTLLLLLICPLAVIFLVYDWVIRRRQTKIMDSAIRTNEIVTSLFPKQVRDRMYNTSTKKEGKREETEHGTDEENQVSVYGSEPIADLYVSATGKCPVHSIDTVIRPPYAKPILPRYSNLSRYCRLYG